MVPVPVTGFALNFSAMPRILPPPFGREIVGGTTWLRSSAPCPPPLVFGRLPAREFCCTMPPQAVSCGVPRVGPRDSYCRGLYKGVDGLACPCQGASPSVFQVPPYDLDASAGTPGRQKEKAQLDKWVTAGLYLASANSLRNLMARPLSRSSSPVSCARSSFSRTTTGHRLRVSSGGIFPTGSMPPARL